LVNRQRQTLLPDQTVIKRRLYIIDGSLTMRAMLQSLIERDGQLALCGTALGAEQALREMPAAEPDILLFDLDLPGMDGFGFMHHCRARHRERWSRMNAVLLSARATRGASACTRAFGKGVDACFDKAFLASHAGDLLALLRHVGTFEADRLAARSRAITLPDREVKRRSDRLRPSPGPDDITLI
jgi:two-component system chemotaxis response regulator CheB